MKIKITKGEYEMISELDSRLKDMRDRIAVYRPFKDDPAPLYAELNETADEINVIIAKLLKVDKGLREQNLRGEDAE